MSKIAGDGIKTMWNTPSARDEHAIGALKEENQEADQQTRTSVKQSTDLQYHADPGKKEPLAAYLDETQSQPDSIVTHDNTSTTRSATSNHNLEHNQNHVTPVYQVDDSSLPTEVQTLKESSFTLGGDGNGQGSLLAIDKSHNNLDTISGNQVRDDATPNMTHNDSPNIANTLHDHAYALIENMVEALRTDSSADSPELASKVPEVRGAVQTEYQSGSNTEVARDIGWHKAKMEIPDPLIGGYTNGELFAFIRRFNKDVFDVRAVPIETASGLDLNDAWSQDHTGDKMALHLQRVYLSVVLGIASFGKQIARLRSWKETCRTSIFCGVYFTAWFFDLLMPLATGILILVVSSVQARNAMFPPAPRALVNIRTGGIQTPQAGRLGTNNTLTGAPEKQQCEAIEEEAANFAANVRHNIQRAIGMHNSQQEDGDEVPLKGKVPKPIGKAVKAVQSAGSAPGHITESTGQTAQPMEEIIWAGVNPESIAKFLDIAPHVIGELADNWERFANALSPAPPFSCLAFFRILEVLAPLFLVSLFVDYYMVYKATGCVIGIAVFGDPMLTPAIAWLKRKVPNYLELVQPKNNILRGVPTNTQVAITLLRIGEAHKTPLPPVPTSEPDDPNHQNPIDVESIPLSATRSEVLDATMPSVVEESHGDDNTEQPNHTHLSKIVRFFKGNAKSVVKTKLAIDHVRAATGSQKAKGHIGVLPKTKSIIYAGPSEYQCRFEGKQGWVVIRESSRPSLLFTRDDPRLVSCENLNSVFEIAVRDMKRVKRATAFVNSAIEAVAAFSSDQKLLASLEIEDKEGKTWRLTVIPERDELFNRLIASGNQRWENM